jgi:hypothetical protein
MSLYVSIILIAIGGIVHLLNLFSENYKEAFEKVPYLKTILSCLSVAIIVFGCYQLIHQLIQKGKHEICTSPSEIRLMPLTNKDFILTVSNNKDFAIFDVHLSICSDNKSIDSLVIVEPVKTDVNFDIPFSMAIVRLSNGCSSIVFHTIDPHSSKEFRVSVKGEKIQVKSRISFLVYDWTQAPSAFSTPITEEESLSWPSSLQEYFDDRSIDTERIGQYFFQKWMAPSNPYFPEEKESRVVSVGYYNP